MDEWLMHGGAVDAAAAKYGVARDKWLDLSTGINPHPYPLPELAQEYWQRLPDAAVDAWLRKSAAECYGARDPALVIPAPGTQAVIQWLPRLVPPGTVAVIGPTYREHEAGWAAAGHTVVEVADLEAVPEQTNTAIVANPNNPDGRLWDPERLVRLATNRLLVVDEAFADVAPEVSLVPHVGRSDLVVLRSFGKFFGLAGMRLGFALTGEPMATRLRRALGPWAVSGPAAAIGAVALVDDAWIRATRVRLTATAGRLDGLLMRSGLRVFGGTSLFRLAEDAHAQDLFEHLARIGILTRPFIDRRHWLRFGVPGSDADFERLATALATWRPRAVALGGGKRSPGSPPDGRPPRAGS